MNEVDFSEIDISDEENWEEETNTEESIVKCIFCDSMLISVECGLNHCIENHAINFKTLMKKFNMDCYSFIKFINYIRTGAVSAEDILLLNEPLWHDDVYLKPVLANDPWLMFDYEEYFLTTPDNANFNSESVVTNEELLAQQKLQLEQKDELISQLTKQLIQMQQVAHKIILDDDPPNGSSESYKQTFYNNIYFESYSHHGIHCDMLLDDVRTLSYKTAIFENKQLFSNKTVLDLGCGTGILSMFAATVGAKKVYAVDNSDIIYNTFDIIKENNFENQIEIIKDCIESNNLPFNKVDIIISEWMGYFLLFEGMLDSVIFARDNFLEKGGVMLPTKCHMYLCGGFDEDRYKKYILFWDDVYGYSMKCMREKIIKEAIVDIVSVESIVTSVDLISTFDLYKCTVNDTNFESFFTITSLKNTLVTFFIGYFDVIFCDENSVKFSTSPHCTPTHWKQTIFYLREPIALKEGENLTGKITCRRNIENTRSLMVTIEVTNQNLTYYLE